MVIVAPFYIPVSMMVKLNRRLLLVATMHHQQLAVPDPFYLLMGFARFFGTADHVIEALTATSNTVATQKLNNETGLKRVVSQSAHCSHFSPRLVWPKLLDQGAMHISSPSSKVPCEFKAASSLSCIKTFGL
jgi:hypothetical protein